jgi:hypothetical protein
VSESEYSPDVHVVMGIVNDVMMKMNWKMRRTSGVMRE